MKRQRQACVLGFGLSGQAAARLLQREGFAVAALDARAGEPALRQVARGMSVELVADPGALHGTACEVYVSSPGLPVEHPWLQWAREAPGGCYSEFEWGWRHYGGMTVAVTGSNGKSTFVKWCAEAMEAAGRRARPCGNYGVPVSSCVLDEPPPEVLLLELSSFQIEQRVAFAPEVAVLLNIYPNHLDRHGSLDAYKRIKLGLFEAMPQGARGVVPDLLHEEARRVNPKLAWTTFGLSPRADYRVEKGCVCREGQVLAELGGTDLEQGGRAENAAAAVALFDVLGLETEPLPAVWRTMEHLPHRTQQVLTVRGIRFVNDSKATNLAALRSALQGFSGGIRLIAGGLSKEESFDSLKEVLAERVECVYLVGRDAQKMERAWRSVVPCRLCGTLDRAVHAAWHDARRDEVILLSPACASFDQHRNYQERGEQFMELAKAKKMEVEHEENG